MARRFVAHKQVFRPRRAGAAVIAELERYILDD
jgi:hypothetical protein